MKAMLTFYIDDAADLHDAYDIAAMTLNTTKTGVDGWKRSFNLLVIPEIGD